MANLHASKPVKIVGRAQRSFVGRLVRSRYREQSRADNKKLDPDAGYIPTVAPEDGKKKKKGDDITQALALPPELPSAVTSRNRPAGVPGHSAFGQRSALPANARRDQDSAATNHGPIVKLRAFVAGSGDLRRIGEIAGEMFLEKHMPLPALTVVLVALCRSWRTSGDRSRRRGSQSSESQRASRFSPRNPRLASPSRWPS